MPGAENLIKRFVYSLPETKYCSTPFGKVPCGARMRDHKIGVYAVFTYPSVSPSQEATIYSCAGAGITAVYLLFATATGVCSHPATAVGCPAAIRTAIYSANPVLRETFHKCIINSGLPSDVKRQCDIGIVTRGE